MVCSPNIMFDASTLTIAPCDTSSSRGGRHRSIFKVFDSARLAQEVASKRGSSMTVRGARPAPSRGLTIMSRDTYSNGDENWYCSSQFSCSVQLVALGSAGPVALRCGTGWWITANLDARKTKVVTTRRMTTKRVRRRGMAELHR